MISLYFIERKLIQRLETIQKLCLSNKFHISKQIIDKSQRLKEPIPQQIKSKLCQSENSSSKTFYCPVKDCRYNCKDGRQLGGHISKKHGGPKEDKKKPNKTKKVKYQYKSQSQFDEDCDIPIEQQKEFTEEQEEEKEEEQRKKSLRIHDTQKTKNIIKPLSKKDLKKQKLANIRVTIKKGLNSLQHNEERKICNDQIFDDE